MTNHRLKTALVPEQALALTERLRPLLAGQHPMLIGAALADLTATWLAGHPDTLRDGVLTMHVDFVRALMPIEADRLALRHGSQGRAP